MLSQQSIADTVPSFLNADGEMAALIREHDWTATKLGSPAGWPTSLKVVVRMALTLRHPIFIYWGEDLISLYNDAFRLSLGPEKHPAILGVPGREAWPETWKIIGPELEFVMQGKGTTWHENQLVPFLRHGAIQDVYWTYSFGPIDDEHASNGVGGVIVVCSETTTQVLEQQQLLTERERLVQLFEQAPSFMVFLQGPKHRVELANPGYMKLIGHRPVLGRDLAEALPDAVEQGYLRLLDQVYASGETLTAMGARYVFRMHEEDPEVERFVDFVFQPIKDLHGVVTGIFVEGVDATDRTLANRTLIDAQTKLKHSEEQLRLATDAGEVGFWDVDLLTDTLVWPPSVKAMFGISPSADVSMADYYAGLHPKDLAATSAAFAGALDPAQRAGYDVEYRTIGKEDGLVRWVAAKGKGIFDEAGRCIRVLGTAIDITRRKDAETLLRETDAKLVLAVEALEDADRKKDAFLATLGHELRNPLGALRNALTLMERAPDNVALRDKARQIMVRQVGQLVRLTDDLLDVNRIRLGKIQLKLEILTLNAVLAHAVESCAQAVELQGQQLELSIPDAAIVIDADSARLVQLFGNLISNASKFTPVGGQIQIVVHVEGKTATTSVKDSGIGLAPDTLLSIFEPFKQLGNSIERSNSGLGIGLALVKQLVEMHGGHIEARSEGLGRGSEFLVQLPLSGSTGAAAS